MRSPATSPTEISYGGSPLARALVPRPVPTARGVARKLRVEYPGAIYRVMDRGDRREEIFKDDKDRARFLKPLGQSCAKPGWQLQAPCLMGSHCHLAADTSESCVRVAARQPCHRPGGPSSGLNAPSSKSATMAAPHRQPTPPPHGRPQNQPHPLSSPHRPPLRPGRSTRSLEQTANPLLQPSPITRLLLRTTKPQICLLLKTTRPGRSNCQEMNWRFLPAPAH